MMRRVVTRYFAGGAAACLVGGMLAVFASVTPAFAAGTITDSPSNATTWAVDVPYGQAGAPTGITVTAKACAAAITSTSGNPAGFTVNGVNAAGVGAVAAGAIGVISYGATNTAATSTGVIGQTAGTASTTYTDANGYMLPGSYTFTFEAWANQSPCVTSATYTLTVANSTFSLNNTYEFDTSFNQSTGITVDAVDSATGGVPTVNSSTPGSGFTCTTSATGYPSPIVDPTVYDHECYLTAAAGPSNGDDSGVTGALGTANTLTIQDPNTSAISSNQTVTVGNPPICVAGTDAAGQSTAASDTAWPGGGIQYAGNAAGPPGGLISGVTAGQKVFTGCSPLYASGFNLTIAANPLNDVVTNSSTNAENDYDTGSAGLSGLAWSGATTSSAPTGAATATTTVPATFKSSDTNATCPPAPAVIDAGLPFCEEFGENSGSGPTYGVVFIQLNGQATPNAPTVAPGSSSSYLGGTVSIADSSGACPSSLTVSQFSNSYNCWWGRAEESTPVTVTVDGIPAAVTGGVSAAVYTYPGTTYSAATLSPPQLSASFTVPATVPLGTQPVEVCESTATNSGNDWQDGAQYLASQVCASTTIDVGPSSTATTPGVSSLVLGGPNVDSAVVTGNGSGNPTGTVSFYECGPTATPQPCTSQANAVGSPVSVSAGAGDTADATSTSFTPDAAGYWCFAGYYSGDSNDQPSSDTSTDECFDVSQNSGETMSTPGSASIVLGATNTDSAQVSGIPAGGSPTGSVAFYECGPTATPQPCTSQANQVGVGSVGLTAGAGDTSSATSVSFTPDATGYWCFGAYYSGDSNYSASQDTNTDECFDVTAATSATVTTPTNSTIAIGASNSDSAVVTGNSAGEAPTGTVTFYECGPSASPQACISGASQVGAPVALTPGAGDSSSAESVTFTPSNPGTWCFAAYYSGDSNYMASSDTSTFECFSVSGIAAPVITSFTPASGPVGRVITIKGHDLNGATSVTFDGLSAKIISDSANKLKAKVPAGAHSGKIKVTTPGGTATSPGKFHVT